MTIPKKFAPEQVGLNALAYRIHDTAMAKGWWPAEGGREFGTLLALVHCEVSEAFEEYREHGMMPYVSRKASMPAQDDDTVDKPEGVPSELADIIIRVLDICAAYGIDIEDVVEGKMVYNDTRSFRHGGKKA